MYWGMYYWYGVCPLDLARILTCPLLVSLLVVLKQPCSCGHRVIVCVCVCVWVCVWVGGGVGLLVCGYVWVWGIWVLWWGGGAGRLWGLAFVGRCVCWWVGDRVGWVQGVGVCVCVGEGGREGGGREGGGGEGGEKGGEGERARG